MEQFAKIVHDYSPRLVAFAQGIVGQREAAEDVVQDALVKAFVKRGLWRGEGAMSTWLYRIVYTTAISSLRRRKAVGAADFSASLEASVSASDSADDEGDWALTDENIDRMRRALEQLGPVDRSLVTLFYIEDRSVRECGQVCSLSEANVKVRLHRARGRLRELMKKEE